MILILIVQACKVLEDNVQETVQTTIAEAPPSHKLRKNLSPLENVFENMNQILSPSPTDADANGGGGKEESVLNGGGTSENSEGVILLDD